MSEVESHSGRSSSILVLLPFTSNNNELQSPPYRDQTASRRSSRLFGSSLSQKSTVHSRIDSGRRFKFRFRFILKFRLGFRARSRSSPQLSRRNARQYHSDAVKGEQRSSKIMLFLPLFGTVSLSLPISLTLLLMPAQVTGPSRLPLSNEHLSTYYPRLVNRRFHYNSRNRF